MYKTLRIMQSTDPPTSLYGTSYLSYVLLLLDMQTNMHYLKQRIFVSKCDGTIITFDTNVFVLTQDNKVDFFLDMWHFYLCVSSILIHKTVFLIMQITLLFTIHNTNSY